MRTITGKVLKIDGSVYTEPAVIIELMNEIVISGVVYPKCIYKVTTESDGTFSIDLPVPDAPITAEYRITMVDGDVYKYVNLTAGPSTDLQTLITIAGSAIPQDAVQTLIDSHKSDTNPHPNVIARNSTAATVTKVYLIGDSLTEGTAGGKYQTYLDTLLGANFTTVNKGTGGETSTQIAARIYTDVIDKGDAGYCIILAGTNNLDIPATVEADLQTMYTACHNAGIKVIALTLPPRTYYSPFFLTINTWIKTNAVNVDYVVDLYPVLNDPANPTHWISSLTIDDIHPNGAGCSLMADTIYAAVTWARQYELTVAGPAALNQALLTTSSPTFAGLAITGPAPFREMLTANRVYYVRTNGSDSNNGLANTAGGAFLTVQHAIDVAATLDSSIYSVTIQLADGTYATDVLYLNNMAGAGEITIQGNASTPANVIVDGAFVKIGPGTTYHVNNLKLIKNVSTFVVGFAISYGAKVCYHGINFGTGFSMHVISSNGGFVAADGNYTISGGATYHWDAEMTGAIVAEGITVTLSGSPVFVAFAVALNMGAARVPSITFTGSATGTRYIVRYNSMIQTNGGGDSYFPGNAGGWMDTPTGGQYA